MKIEVTLFLALCCLMTAEAIPKKRSLRQNLEHLRASLAIRQRGVGGGHGGGYGGGWGDGSGPSEASFQRQVLEKLEALNGTLSVLDGYVYYMIYLLEELVYGDDYYDDSYWETDSYSSDYSGNDSDYSSDYSGNDSDDSGNDSDESGNGCDDSANGCDDSGNDSDESANGCDDSGPADVPSKRRLGPPSAFKKRLLKELARNMRFRKW